ncbi:hypothetical protein RS3R2_41990 [Pseudomonas lactis]|nr:hypothetical protein RS3R2_41990 [Pseudomonas lactis]
MATSAALKTGIQLMHSIAKEWRYALMSEEHSDAVEKFRYTLQHYVHCVALVDGGAAGGGLRLH